MKLRMLKTRPDSNTSSAVPGRRGALHVIGGETRIFEWPYSRSECDDETPDVHVPIGGGIEVKAEVQAKWFRDRSVDAERFSATLQARDDSPAAILAALADAVSSIGELRAAGNPGDHVILQISLRS